MGYAEGILSTSEIQLADVLIFGRSMSLGFTTRTRVCTSLWWTKSRDEDMRT